MHRVVLLVLLVFVSPTFLGPAQAACFYLVVPVMDGQTWINGCDVQVNGVVLPDQCGPVVRIAWDWGDGHQDWHHWFPAPHTYSTNGQYTVTVTAFDAAGNSQSTTYPISVTSCSPQCNPQDARPQEVVINENCGLLTGRGVISATWSWTLPKYNPAEYLEFDSGEMLYIDCGGGFLLPQYRMFYVSPTGTHFQVGVCPYEGGCNSIRYWHTGDADGSGNPDCLVKSEWISRDFGKWPDIDNAFTGIFPDGSDREVHHAVTDFDAINSSITKTQYTYELKPGLDYPIFDCPSNAHSLLVRRTAGVDPPLGPETEAFFALVDASIQVHADGEPMSVVTGPLCDLSGDDLCDEEDYLLFLYALGSCSGDASYNPLADGNGDGCVGEGDELLLEVPTYSRRPVVIDVKPGSDRNPIKMHSKGLIPVAVLSTDGFSAVDIDQDSVGFGPQQAGKAHAEGHMEDVDLDGDMDLVLHFRTELTGLACGDTEVQLLGHLSSGEGVFIGSDSIVTICR